MSGLEWVVQLAVTRRVCDMMRESGATQRSIAGLLGIDAAGVSRRLSFDPGRARPWKIGEVYVLAEAFGVPVASFYPQQPASQWLDRVGVS